MSTLGIRDIVTGDRGEGSGFQCHEGDRRPGDEACRDRGKISDPRDFGMGDQGRHLRRRLPPGQIIPQNRR
jgi:hypothetical protein